MLVCRSPRHPGAGTQDYDHCATPFPTVLCVHCFLSTLLTLSGVDLPVSADDELNSNRTVSNASYPSISDTEFLSRNWRANSASLAKSLVSSADEFPSDVPRRIGEYRLHRLIGVGGMGRVFLAEHLRMQRSVALKVLPLERMKDEVWVRRFFDEIRVASKLLHPNIVTAFDAGEFDGLHYLAMEYIDGVTLSAAVEQSGSMSIGETASIIRQAAMGLHHAHRAGIIHRDVKPGNLMRATDGSVKVLDVGLAHVSQQQWKISNRVREVSGRARSFVGTPSFMAPEQIDDADSVDVRSDIYSLGATLFFLLVGRPPYTGAFLDIVDGHRTAELPELMRLNRDVDLTFDHIFRRMMAKSPAARFGSLDEVIDELEPYAEARTTPSWISDLSIRTSRGELSAVSSGSLATNSAHIIAIDVGMTYITSTQSDLAGNVELLSSESDGTPYTRLAIADDGKQILFGEAAVSRRESYPQSVIHCLPLYIGKKLVDRPLGAVQYPPEVLLAMALKDLVRTKWIHQSNPDAAGIVVPSIYDQLHRRSMLQASTIAGLKRVRLIDRSLAAIHAVVCRDALPDTPLASDTLADSAKARHLSGEINVADNHEQSPIVHRDPQLILFLGLTYQASEIAIIRHHEHRLHQLSCAGHWNTGALSWLQVMVNHVARRVEEVYGKDVRNIPATAAAMQVRCERAISALFFASKARVSIPIGAKRVDLVVQRDVWLKECLPLFDQFVEMIHVACKRASVSLDRVGSCVLLGPFLRLPEIRANLVSELGADVPIETVDRADVARGAALCLVAELPGRTETMMPPRGATNQTIGIVIEDKNGRPRIFPMIPRGSVLPARANRRLAFKTTSGVMTLEVVESSGVSGEKWHALGRYTFDLDRSASSTGTRLVSFEVDVNGLLNVRVQSPTSSGSTKLPKLPSTMLSDEEVGQWSEELNKKR